jgi:hypothetical protein
VFIILPSRHGLEFFAVAVKNVQPRARLTSKGGAGYGNYFARVRFAKSGNLVAFHIKNVYPRSMFCYKKIVSPTYYFANVRFAQGGYFSAIFIVDEVPRVI